jgi:hypothetical protein
MIGALVRKHSRVVRLLIVASLLGALALTAGTASAATTAPAQAADPWVVHSLPSFTESGYGATSSSLADIIQVECLPTFSEDFVTISSQQLYDMCHGTLMWAAANAFPFAPAPGISIRTSLDDDGNATVAVWGGPSCAPGPALITAELQAAPYATAATLFVALPPRDTTVGLTALPAAEVEDSNLSAIAAIIQVEYPSQLAESMVNINAPQLFNHCAGGLTWVGPEAGVLGTGVNTTRVSLDDNGNAFVVVLGGPSCAAGLSLITADLTVAPYRTLATLFDILSPRPTFPPPTPTPPPDGG